MWHKLLQFRKDLFKQPTQINWKLSAAFLIALFFILRIWTISTFESLSFDSDLGRDLKEISNIANGQVVWLGPWLGPGFHASSIYYYLFTPSYILSEGHPHGLIYMNLIIGLVAIITFGVLAIKKGASEVKADFSSVF